MPPTFLRSGKNGGTGTPGSPIVVTVTGNAGEQATLEFATGYAAAGAQSVPTITGGGTWSKQGSTAIVTAGSKASVETWTNDGTAFTSLSTAFTNAPSSVAIGVRLDSGVTAIGNNTTTTVASALSFPVSLTMQEALNELVAGWAGDDASTPDPYSAGASTNLRDQLAESSASDVNFGFGDRSGGPGSITATLTVAAASCNVAVSAVELRSTTVAGGGAFYVATKQPARLNGPYDPRGFLLSNFTRFNYTPSAVAAAASSFRRTLHPFGTSKGRRTGGK